MKNLPTYWIDLFAGAGGTSTGIHLTESKVIACVNHDKTAIASHKANHPNAVHFTENVRDYKVVAKLQQIVKKYVDKHDGKCNINIWASLECTNYSKAKGGLPRDADSRTLAWDLLMYLDLLQPDFLYIENVREFMAWGALDENGRPISMDKGKEYQKWVNAVKERGFNYDFRLLNSADFGAYTSRLRYFGIFAREGKKIAWPEPTHYDPRKVKNQISMFDQTQGKEKWKSVRDVLDLEDKGKSIFNRKKPLSENTLKRIYEGLVKFVAQGQREFLTTYYGNGSAHNVELPCPTLGTKDTAAVKYLLYDYTSFTASSLDSPAGAVTTVPKHNLVSTQWLTDTQFGRIGQELDKPSFTLIARMDKKPPYKVDAEYLNSYNKNGEVKYWIAVYETDSEMTVKIKEFMAWFGIADISMRMLNIPELKRIQGFGEDYILKGTKTQQKKQIGNAVVPIMAQKLVEANINCN